MEWLVYIILGIIGLSIIGNIYGHIVDSFEEAKHRANTKRWHKECEARHQKMWEEQEREKEKKRREYEKKIKRSFNKAKALKRRYLRSDLTMALLNFLKEQGVWQDIAKISVYSVDIAVSNKNHVTYEFDGYYNKSGGPTYDRFGFKSLPQDKEYPYLHEMALAMAINELSGNRFRQETYYLYDKKNYKEPEPPKPLRDAI